MSLGAAVDVRARGRFPGAGCALALLALAPACGDSGGGPEPTPATVERTAVATGPYNTLSAVVTAILQDADSVRVRYGIRGAALDSTTPVMRAGDSVDVQVLGLVPETEYRLLLVAYGEGDPVLSDTLSLATGALPADLPQYQTGGTSPSPGYVAFAAGTYGIVIDNTGRVVWYRQLPSGMTLNFQPQPNGRYLTHPVTAPAGDTEPWVEIDALGAITRHLGCINGLRSRFHDIMVTTDGSYWLLCDDTRTMDLTAFGGDAAAQVTGTVVQHVSAERALLFEWNAFDHFDITDLDQQSRTGPMVNWTHGNALDLDAEGNLVVSFRSLSEITKISTTSGAVIWRMGGLRNQFTYQESGLPFTRQHGVRITAPGRLQLFDNLGEQTGSRAERYEFIEAMHTVRRTEAFSASPDVTSLLGGSTQPLPGGRILVAYGNANRVQEYDDAGAVVWEILGDPGYIFRAERIASLYAPGVGTPR